jgi:hemerythrin
LFLGRLGGMQDHGIFIKWSPEYNLGIPIIDEQHRGIVSIINSLYYAMQHNYIRSILEPIIGMLHDYTHIHFQIEESFFEKSSFPDAKNHVALHQELMSKLAEVGRKSMLDKDPYQLMDFLKKWWISHICEVDMGYREHLLTQGDL